MAPCFAVGLDDFQPLAAAGFCPVGEGGKTFIDVAFDDFSLFVFFFDQGCLAME